MPLLSGIIQSDENTSANVQKSNEQSKQQSNIHIITSADKIELYVICFKPDMFQVNWDILNKVSDIPRYLFTNQDNLMRFISHKAHIFSYSGYFKIVIDPTRLQGAKTIDTYDCYEINLNIKRNEIVGFYRKEPQTTWTYEQNPHYQEISSNNSRMTMK